MKIRILVLLALPLLALATGGGQAGEGVESDHHHQHQDNPGMTPDIVRESEPTYMNDQSAQVTTTMTQQQHNILVIFST